MTFNNIGSLLIREKLFKFLKKTLKFTPFFLVKLKSWQLLYYISILKSRVNYEKTVKINNM